MAAKQQIDISAGLVPQQQIDLSAGMVPVQGQQQAAPPENPADFDVLQSFAHMFGIPASSQQWDAQAKAVKEQYDYHKKSLPEVISAPGVGMLEGYDSQVKAAASKAKQEYGEALQNVREGGPVGTNALKGGAAIVQGGIGAIPFVGPGLNNLSEQVLKENYGGAAGSALAALLQALTLKSGKPAAAELPEASYLSKLPAPKGAEPITLTAGERSGPGAVNAIEPIAAKTSLVAGKVAKFLADRQAVLKQSLDNYRKLITEGAPAPAPSDLASGVQNEGAAALQRSAQVRDALNEQRAKSMTGQPAISPAEAGSQVAEAVNKINDAALGKEGQAIGAVRQQADAAGIKVPYDETAALAKSEFERNTAAEAAGKGLYPPEVKAALQKMSGQGIKDAVAEAIAGKGTTYDTLPLQLKAVADKMIAATPNEHPFGAAADARSAINQAVRRMDRAGELDSQSKAALQKLSESLTSDMTKALPPELAAPWEAARSAYSAQKAAVRGNQFLSSLTREVGNPKGESVLSTLFQRGNESDAAALMQHLKNDPKATAVLQRSAMDFIHDAPDARTALKNLEQRPGFEAILGDKYRPFLRSLQNQAALEFSPAEANYNQFLKGVTKMPEPEMIADKALNSPTFASRMETLLQPQPAIKAQFGQHLFQKVLDKATTNGAFGAKGAYLDPVQLAQEFRAADSTLSRFISPEVMHNLRDFANNAEKLTFSHDVPLDPRGSLTAGYKNLTTLQRAGIVAKSVFKGAIGGAGIGGGIGAATGHFGLGTEIGGALGSILNPVYAELGPVAFIKFALSPRGSRWLAGETRMAALARQGTAAGILATQATASQRKNTSATTESHQ
jgi:hypothetical protein